MTIILFLVDTSASMCQKAHVNGVQKTYLDIAKGAVETFLKYRQRSQDCMGDRYMLLTFEDPPSNVKAGWKENHATFMNELKNLSSTGLTSMGEALKNAFDLLNLNRMQSGIDTYGQGRCPFYLEPSVIIVLTDGGKYSFRNGIHQDIILPLHAQIPGTKFTKEPFRWDQRLFSLVLRMAGNKLDERVEGKVPHDDSPIEKMCEVTGGRSYRVKSHYVLNQCIESLVQKVQPGVVVHFEPFISKDLKDGEIQDIVMQTTKKMIYVQKHPSQKTFPVGFWPIPEPYYPDPKAATLPPRDAHPKIKIMTSCIDEPQMVRNFPVDKYELEASPLTLQILSKREPTKCWSVVVANAIHGHEMPFGYLKANNTFTQVYLMVLPYNYSTLLPLLNDLFHKFNLNPPNDWSYKFTSYVRSIPQYYCPFLRRALASANVPYQLLQYILPENLDGYLSPVVANYLKQMKNTAKQDQENLCLRVFKQLKLPKPPYHQIETTKLYCGQPLKRDLVTHPMLKETFSKMHNDINTFDNYTIVVPSVLNSIATKNYRNPFDIPRRDLIDEISRMRENFFRLPTSGVNIYTKDAGHSLPISEMGNYQEYLKNKEPPLREIEPTNVRQHMFGNPYKKDKHMVMVDEADLNDVAPMKSNTNAPKKVEFTKPSLKRKAGPIRKDYIFRRTSCGSRESSSIHSHSSSASSSSSTLSTYGGSDFDDDTNSDTNSSIMNDDCDENRLVVDFDFNEPVVEDFSMNGHIQDFINGDIEDVEETIQTNNNINNNNNLATINSNSNTTNTNNINSNLNITNNNINNSNIINNNNINNSINNCNNNIIITSNNIINNINNNNSISNMNSNNNNNNSNIIINNNNNNISNSNSNINNISSNNINPNSNVVPINAAILVNHHHQSQQQQQQQQQSPPIAIINPLILPLQQNDINDAQEISKILQQCHNGNIVVTGNDKDNIKIEEELETEPANINVEQQHHHHHHLNNEHENQFIKKEENNMNDYDVSINNNDCDKNGDYELNDEQKETIKLHNLETRTIVFKDIRRPGRDYTLLMEHLNQVKGNFETRFNFVKMCISESLRFRRKKMADTIQDWWEKQIDILNLV